MVCLKIHKRKSPVGTQNCLTFYYTYLYHTFPKLPLSYFSLFSQASIPLSPFFHSQLIILFHTSSRKSEKQPKLPYYPISKSSCHISSSFCPPWCYSESYSLCLSKPTPSLCSGSHLLSCFQDVSSCILFPLHHQFFTFH